MKTQHPWTRLGQMAWIGVLLLAGIFLAACQPVQPPPPSSAATASIPEVTIAVDDNGFTIPDNFPGGIVAVIVQNNSSQDLDVSFARVREGTSVDEVKLLYEDLEDNLAQLLQMVGAMPSINPVYAGQSDHMIIDFRTGHFLVVANEHVGDVPPPGTRYIWGEFAADQLVSTTEPHTDVKVEMDDFAYVMPDEIEAGKQLWEFANTGDQWHMMFLAKLGPDTTMDDVVNFIMTEGEPSGPPPFEVVLNGGIAPISEGERAWVEFSLEPGTYVAVCPIPDVAAMLNGEAPLPHAAHGMIRQFTVTGDGSATAESAVPAVTIVARDYAFDVPAGIPAGLVSLTLKNEGAVNHHAFVTRLKEGVTLEQVQAFLADEQADPSNISDLSFFIPDTDPGSSNEAVVDLAPGNWAIFSFSMDDMTDPRPDWAKGSLNIFTVEGTGGTAASTVAPQADLVLTIGTDDADMPAELSAGPHTIQVINESGQADGWAFFIKLEGDATVADILAMFDAFFSGQEPAKMVDFHAVGGLMGYDLSNSFYTTIDFAPGNYAVITSIGATDFPYSGLAKNFTVQ